MASPGGPTGRLEFCRKPDLMPPSTGAIRLPAGALFEDYGRQDDPSGAYDKSRRWPLSLALEAPLELGKGRRCASAPAIITATSKVRAISPRDKRHLEFIGGDETAPDGVFDLDITVATPFR